MFSIFSIFTFVRANCFSIWFIFVFVGTSISKLGLAIFSYRFLKNSSSLFRFFFTSLI
jgi:hypothetical protein